MATSDASSGRRAPAGVLEDAERQEDSTKRGPSRPGVKAKSPSRGMGPAPWLIPLLVLVTLFYVYPSVQVLRFSFTDASLLRPAFSYGFDSYARALTDPSFFQVVWITLIFVLASIFFQLVLGLMIALAVNHGNQYNLPGTGFARTLVLSSWVMPGIVIGIVWQIVLNSASYGMVNSILSNVGLPTVGFLSGPTIALWSVILANVWRGTAFSMILLYAGLRAIDPVLYEAGEVDGASGWQAFWRITLPSLRPVLLVNLVLISIQTFNTFDMVLALTGGGPGRATEVIALRAYNTIFTSFSLGQGSVLAVVMLLLSLVFTLIYVRYLSAEEQI